MAERALLLIVQAAVDELGSINRPTSVVGSSDAQVQQLLALANREGKELSAREGRDGGWPQLRKEYTFSTAIGTASYAFPSDLQYFMNTTTWDRSQKWPLDGPISPQVWQVLKSGTVGSVGPRSRFRVMENLIYIDPTPTTVNSMVLEYYSDTWCESSGGTAQRLWASDTDKPRLPDDLFILGLIWRFRKAKGLDYQEDFNSYESFVSMKLGQTGMAPIIDFAQPAPTNRFIDELNIPDTGYGGV
jgi:hypothetical protein